MQNSEIVAMAVAGVVILSLAGLLIYAWRRTRLSRDHFRPVVQTGDRRKAESALARHEHRVPYLEIRPLSVSDQQRFSQQWMLCQTQFVDDPEGAVEAVDRLLTEVIRARGYSADDQHERMANMTAAYPQHATRYRIADELLTRHRCGGGSMQVLSKAFVHCRELLADILEGQNEELRRVS